MTTSKTSNSNPASSSEGKDVVLSVKNVSKTFQQSGGLFFGKAKKVSAVTDVSFDIRRGRTLGLVGESGCGKSTLGRVIVRLLKPDSGEIIFRSTDLAKLDNDELKPFRQHVQIIFQDPYASLNPRMTIENILLEPFVIHNIGTPEERRARINELLKVVGLRPEILSRYPHEFSGGQRQRIGIARALTLNPSLIVADEPVSALDVSVQAQVLNLIRDLQIKFGISFLFIAHDLAVVQHISDDVGVMYLGSLVEKAESTDLYARPLHPYTQALLSAVPIPDPKIKRSRVLLTGEIPSPLNPPSGCRFHTRCPKAMPQCTTTEPNWTNQSLEPTKPHLVKCHLFSNNTGS